MQYLTKISQPLLLGRLSFRALGARSPPSSESRSLKLSPKSSDALEFTIALLDYASEVLLGKKRKTHLQSVEVSIVSLEALAGYGYDLNQIEATAFFSNGSTVDLTGQLDWNVIQGGEYISFRDGDYVLNFVSLGLGQVESFWERKTNTINIMVSNHQP